MKEAFIKRTFNSASLATIERVNQILTDYEQDNLLLTLRQLYYQLVSKDLIPNTQKEYKNLGNLVSNARQAGLIDWDMIEDRGRDTNMHPQWGSPADIVESVYNQFRIDRWAKQAWHIEVMVEKDALSGVLIPVCRGLHIGLTANKGYSSSSTMYEIGQRLYQKFNEEDKEICVIYLGDHDPSGIDMGRDVRERLQMYSRIDDIEVVRVALNWDQIKVLKPPENPAKETDSRYGDYVSQYGRSSWELDAVEPRRLAQLVTDTVLKRRDEDEWQAAIETENDMKAELKAFVDQYNKDQNDDDTEDDQD